MANDQQQTDRAPEQPQPQAEQQTAPAPPKAPETPPAAKGPVPAEVAPERPALDERPLDEALSAVPPTQAKVQDLMSKGPAGMAPTPEQVGVPEAADGQRSTRSAGQRSA